MVTICSIGKDAAIFVIAYQFRSNSITPLTIEREKDLYDIKKLGTVEGYSITASEIIWFGKDVVIENGRAFCTLFEHTLSRKTGNLVISSDEYPSWKKRYPCQIFAEEEGFNIEMSRIRDSLQVEYDKEREGNLL